jgi:hypothetical protein
MRLQLTGWSKRSEGIVSSLLGAVFMDGEAMTVVGIQKSSLKRNWPNVERLTVWWSGV